MQEDNNAREETIGRVANGLAWLFFAARFILTASVILLIVLFFLKKPLWLAPVIAVGLYLFYRFVIIGLIWGLIGRLASHEEKAAKQTIYDPGKQMPVIRASVCNGEKVAGFKDKGNGRFTEVMVIRSEADLEEFKKMCGVDEIKVEY